MKNETRTKQGPAYSGVAYGPVPGGWFYNDDLGTKGPTMKRVLLAAMTAALLSSPALAQDSDWTIGSRTLPAPAGASDALRAAIANTPQPDVTKHIRNTTFTTREEWVQSIRAANAGNTQRAGTEALAALVGGEFLLEHSLSPEAEYGFKHPLTQEVAYRSLLGDRRARLHADVARAIEAADAERLDERAALLAYHWENAGERLVAATWHARAARWAGVDSPPEAIWHWARVWDILAEAPESDASTALRLEAAQVQLQLGVRQGLSTSRCEQIFAEGRRLAEAKGDARALITLLINFGKSAHMLAGTPRLAPVFFQEAIDVAERAGDRDGRFSGREALSCVNMYFAEYDTTLRLCEEALAISGDDPSVGLSIAAFGAGFVHVNKGWALTDLGRYEEAVDAFRRGNEGLHRLDASEPVGWTDGFTARLLSRMGDVRGALAAAGRSVASAEEVGSFIALVNAYAHHGMALLQAVYDTELRFPIYSLCLDGQTQIIRLHYTSCLQKK